MSAPAALLAPRTLHSLDASRTASQAAVSSFAYLAPASSGTLESAAWLERAAWLVVMALGLVASFATPPALRLQCWIGLDARARKACIARRRACD